MGYTLTADRSSTHEADDSSHSGEEDSGSESDAGSPSLVSTHGAFLSTSGAFNGSGISALATKFSNISAAAMNDNEDQAGNLLVFFQHYNGEIRWIQRSEMEAWEGGSSNEIVASDAKNGTPITAMSARPDGVRQLHVFCTCMDHACHCECPARQY